MPIETPSLFAQVIQDHLELKRRNAELERELPLDRYMSEDPFENHPLFKTEEQARLEETMGGEESFPGDAAVTGATRDDTGEHTLSEVDESLWSRSREFDWGE